MTGANRQNTITNLYSTNRKPEWLHPLLKKYNRDAAFALDFHSTHRDVLYLLADEYRDTHNDVAMNWIFRFARSMPNRKILVYELADRVSYATSLSWMNRLFGCLVAVYEVGKEPPRDQLVIAAENTSRAIIEELIIDGWDGRKQRLDR